MTLVLLLTVSRVLKTVLVWLLLKSHNICIWIVVYLWGNSRTCRQVNFKNIYLYHADQYEPYSGNAGQEVIRELVDNSVESYLKLSDKDNLLRRNENDELAYRFIHGKWALTNSREDKQWCCMSNKIKQIVSAQ